MFLIVATACGLFDSEYVGPVIDLESDRVWSVDSEASEPEPRDSDRPSIELGCENFQPILGPDGTETGYVRCEKGGVNRVGPAHVAATGDPVVCERQDEYGSAACFDDTDCEGELNRCHYFHGEFTWDCTCVATCRTDADCGEGMACLPHEAVHFSKVVVSQCVPASCTSAEDCPSGECGVYADIEECSDHLFAGLACREADNECRGSTADCRTCETPRFNCEPYSDCD